MLQLIFIKISSRISPESLVLQNCIRGKLIFVSRRGVKFGYWSHLGCSRQNVIILVKVSFRVAREEIYLVSSFYLLNSCNQSLL